MTEHDMGWTRGNWRTIPGLNGYEASYSGRLRKLTRNGPRIVKPNGIGPCGFFTVQIPETGQFHQLGKLTAAAWLGPKPDGLTVRYLDGNLQNHTVPNLAYGTWAELQADQAARAEREEAAGAPTHCEQGHRLAPTWSGGWGNASARNAGPRTTAVSTGNGPANGARSKTRPVSSAEPSCPACTTRADSATTAATGT